MKNEAKKAKIAVLSLNPGVDRTMYLDAPLQKGEVNRASSVSFGLGCKGGNAAVILARQGADVTHFTFTGGELASVYESFFVANGVRSVAIYTAAGVRLNLKLSEKGFYTECNQKGGPVQEKELAQMQERLRLAEFDCLYLAGSLPQGVPADFYASCVALAHEKGALAVVDCDGEALRKALAAGVDLIKPNRTEFFELVEGGESVREKIALFCKTYPQTRLLLSLGGDGAIYTGEEGLWFAEALKTPVCGTVAAGDTMLSSFINARLCGEGETCALAIATAAAAAKVALEGSILPTAEQMLARVGEVVVTEYKE